MMKYNTRKEVNAKGEELLDKLNTLCEEIKNFIYNEDVDIDNLEVIEEYGKWNTLFYNRVIKHQ